MSINNRVANCALKLAKKENDQSKKDKYLELAHNYNNKIIETDPNNKFAYHLKGQIIEEEAKDYNAALKAYDKALECDSGYADAQASKIALELKIANEIAKKGEADKELALKKFQEIARDIKAATNIKKTDYNERKIAELEKIAKKNKLDAKVELPKEKFQAETPEYIAALAKPLEIVHNRIKELEKTTKEQGKKIEEVKEEVKEHAKRLDDIEDRMDIFSKDQYSIKEAMDLLTKDVSQLKASEQQENTELKKIIRNFGTNPDLNDYFSSFISEFTRSYIASQSANENNPLANQDIKVKGNTNFRNVASFLKNSVVLIPTIGEAAKLIIGGATGLADSYYHSINMCGLKKIKNLAGTISEFDKISLRLGAELTQQNEGDIISLEQQRIEPETILQNIKTGNMKALFDKLNKNEDDKTQPITKSNLLGQSHAAQIITYLQQGDIAKNLQETNESEIDGESYKSKATIIASDIVCSMNKLKEATLINIKEVQIKEVQAQERRKPSNIIKPSDVQVLEKQNKCCAIA
jgi:uncharacterized coiled-coil protein SlyX